VVHEIGFFRELPANRLSVNATIFTAVAITPVSGGELGLYGKEKQT
jgi:hypothetical protein